MRRVYVPRRRGCADTFATTRVNAFAGTWSKEPAGPGCSGLPCLLASLAAMPASWATASSCSSPHPSRTMREGATGATGAVHATPQPCPLPLLKGLQGPSLVVGTKSASQVRDVVPPFPPPPKCPDVSDIIRARGLRSPFGRLHSMQALRISGSGCLSGAMGSVPSFVGADSHRVRRGRWVPRGDKRAARPGLHVPCALLPRGLGTRSPGVVGGRPAGRDV